MYLPVFKTACCFTIVVKQNAFIIGLAVGLGGFLLIAFIIIIILVVLNVKWWRKSKLDQEEEGKYYSVPVSSKSHKF